MANLVNKDLRKERECASFSISELTSVIDGGKEKTDRRRFVESLAKSDPLFDDKERYIRDQETNYELAIRRNIRFCEFQKEYNLNGEEDWDYFALYLANDLAFGIHNKMFSPTIEKLGTKEQKAKWLSLANSYKIIGTYAQTELGHGTNLSGLETTATYDKTTQEFELNTPALTSMKWWPGAMGKTVNYALVMATLVIDDRRYGLQPFIVQLRSLEDHQPMPGIKIGDVGRQFNYDGINNGYLMMSKVRVPRNHMLMGFAEVTPDGIFKKSGDLKITYSSMMYMRVFIVKHAANAMAMALTIAIRYSAVRRQGKIKKSEPEVQLLDYQTQRHKLFPGLATTYAVCFVAQRLFQLYLETENKIQKGDFSLLAELHSLCTGLKAYTTWIACEFINLSRFCCGGHGYLMASGLPWIYSRYSVTCTYEGDNTVMMIQTARSLMKNLKLIEAGKAVVGQSFRYLEGPLVKHWEVTSQGNVSHMDVLVSAYKHRSQQLNYAVAKRLLHLITDGISPDTAWNDCTVDLVHAAKAHIQYYIVESFYLRLVEIKVSETLLAVLQKLFKLYALHGIEEYSGDFLQDGFVSSEQIGWIHNEYLKLLDQIRPEAVVLVDAFDIADEALESVLGSYDGNAYQRLFDSTKLQPRNKDEIHEMYNKYLKSFLQGSSKL